MKKLLSFIFTLCLIIPATFMLSACDITEDKNIQVRVQDGYVQWAYEGDDTWINVVSVDDVKDALGDGYQGVPGQNGIDGREVEFQKGTTYIQWRYVGETSWKNLIALSEIKGEDGQDGTNGTNGKDGINGTNGKDGQDGEDGADGREVEFQKGTTHIQWRYVGETSWRNLIALSEIKGEDGQDLTKESLEVKLIVDLPTDFEYYTTNTSINYIDNWMSSRYSKGDGYYFSTIESGDWLNLFDFSYNEVLSEYFLGWYAGDGANSTRFTSYTPIQDNVTLTAKWDLDRIALDKTGTDGLTADYTFAYNMGGYIITSYSGADTEIIIPKLMFAEYGRPGLTMAFRSNAFDNSTNITSIILPDTIRNIPKLEGFTNLKYNEYKGINYLGTKDNPYFALVEPLDKTLTDYDIYPLTEVIGDYAFEGTNIYATYSKIPNKVKSIGSYAFENCESLSAIHISKNVKYIGAGVFFGCNNLNNILIDSDNQYYSDGSHRNCVVDIRYKTLIAACKGYSLSDELMVDIEVIEMNAYCDKNLESIVITENITGENLGFGAVKYQYLYTITIDSATIADGLKSSYTCIGNATTVYIKTGLETANSTYLLENFTKQATSDKTGYDKYVRN